MTAITHTRRSNARPPAPLTGVPLLVAVAVLFTAPPAKSQVCGILEFGGTGELITKNIVVCLTSAMASEVASSGKCERVESYASSDFDDGCPGDAACLSTFGKDHGLRYLFTGTVHREGDTFAVRLRLFDGAAGSFSKSLRQEIPSDPAAMPEYVAGFASTLCGAIRGDGVATESFDDGVDDILAADYPVLTEVPVEEEPVDEPPPSDDFDTMLDDLSDQMLDDLATDEQEDDAVGESPVEDVRPDDGLVAPDEPSVEAPRNVALRATFGFAYYQGPSADIAFGAGFRLHRSLWLDIEIGGLIGSVTEPLEPWEPDEPRTWSYLLMPVAVGVVIKGAGSTARPFIGFSATLTGFYLDESDKPHIGVGARVSPGIEIGFTRQFGMVLHTNVGFVHAKDLPALTGDYRYAETTIVASARAGVYVLF